MKKRSLAAFISGAAVFFAFSVSGCKSDEQLKTQVTELAAKLEDATKKLSEHDNQLHAANGEIRELKELVAKLGNAVVDMKKGAESVKKPLAKPAAHANKKAAVHKSRKKRR